MGSVGGWVFIVDVLLGGRGRGEGERGKGGRGMLLGGSVNQ